jgi:hypothetical protein
VQAGDVRDFALVDAAACLDPFIGARAIVDPGRVRVLVLARAGPWSVGLSGIGRQLRRVRPRRTPDSTSNSATVRFGASTSVVALAAERELAVTTMATVVVARTGPRVIDGAGPAGVAAALAAQRAGARHRPPGAISPR